MCPLYVKKLFLISILVLFSLAGYAQTTEASTEFQSDTLDVYFHQGYSTWVPEYMENEERMQAFVERFRKQYSKSRVFSKISKIHIVSGCSPEGYWSFNQRLSQNRANRIRNVLKEYITLPDSVIVENSRGVNWIDLVKMVEADPNVPYRDEVLDIIHNTSELREKNGKTIEARKLALMYLRDGKPWQYMYNNIFPKLRIFNLQIVVEWEVYKEVVKEVLGDTIPPVPTKSVPLDYTVSLPQIKFPAPEKEFYMGVKSNMVYDALLVPNIGVEFYLGKRWTVGGNWMYAWWKHDARHYYWRVYGGDIAVRKWFGSAAERKPLTGHHVGLYGQMLTYDFETGGRGYMGGEPGGTLWNKANYVAGLEYGYSLPVAKRFNIDFVVGAGYMWGEYHEYIPVDNCYVWQVTKKRNWFGPTKAEISLVWLIGKGNINYDKIRKGGKDE